MEESLFIKWVQQFFKGITVKSTETLNGQTGALTYLHKTMLRKQFSVSGKWESISASNTLVMADIVAMDSSLPLKNLDRIGRASGEITKMGIEMWLNETQLTELDTLVATGANDAQILARLFEHTPKVIGGIYERNEQIFLEGFSSGVALVQDDENVGTGIRLDYGYLAANKFTSSTAWTANGATPFTDLLPLFDKASLDGSSPTVAYTDRATLNGILKSAEAKEMYAFTQGYNTANVPNPTLSQLNNAAQDRYGFQFQMVDRSVQKQINGVNTPYKPWKTGSVVLTNQTQVGNLVYARLAEQNHPVAGVTYNTVEDYILVSKFRKNRPSLSEYTNAQARVVPVINNVESIYVLDSTVTAG